MRWRMRFLAMYSRRNTSIRAVIERDDLIVTKVKTQSSVDNVHGHSVRFDVLANDSEGNFYNIEIQNASHDNLLARADFYGASI